jgi:dTDP-4-amino-4,6-dideoxygalactose transaminase
MTYIIALGQPTVGEELAAPAKVFRSGWLAGAGPACRKFERRFAAAVGTRHAVTTSNCGSALFLGLKVPVLAGQPGGFDQYRAIADKHGLWLCEDAACAADATYQTRPAGSSLTWPAFSFHGRKGITAGEGGAPVSDRDDLIAHARTLHTYDIEPAIVRVGSGEWATPELARAGLQRPARRSKTRPA